MSTHVDDVLCTAKDPQKCMDKLAEKCNLCDVGPPAHCLGNSCTKIGGRWLTSAGKCVKEAVSRTEECMGTLSGKRVPSSTNHDHPETDELPLLSDDGARNCQVLIGMVQWLVIVGRLDMTCATSSLS